MLILYFTIGVLFISCSSNNEDSDNSSNGVGLPVRFLGAYSFNLKALSVSNELGAATLTESDSRVYSINFSDNVTAIANITFASVGNNSSFTFTDTDRGIVITVGSSETEDNLSVFKSSDPIVSFGGRK